MADLDKLYQNDSQLVEVSTSWGKVYVKALTLDEADSVERLIVKHKCWRACYVAVCTLDENGKRLFSDNDIPKLGKVQRSKLEPIVEQVAKLNLITDEEIKEVEANFPETPS